MDDRSTNIRPEAPPATSPPDEPATPGESSEPAESSAPEPSEGIVERVVGSVVGVLGSMIGAASEAWSFGEALVERRVRRAAREPLANLYELYPEARSASPRELGMRFVPTEDIRGTAVAGAAQRGGDFLPLKPFRGENWEGRWRRISQAYERMQPLPPVDLIKFDGDYWVVDGHNRVAAALYGNGAGLDAMVTELVPMDGHTSERPANVLSFLGEAAELRAAAQGHRPAMGMRQAELLAGDGREPAEEPAEEPAVESAETGAHDPAAED